MTLEIQALDLPIDSLTLDSYSNDSFVTTSTPASAFHETLDIQNNNGNGEIAPNALPHERVHDTRGWKSCSTGNKISVKRKLFAVDAFDFESYEYQMRVDRIDIDIALGNGKSGAAGTNFTSVRNSIRGRTRQNLYVRPLAIWDERRSALSFRITIQDPTMKSIRAIVDSLQDDFDVVSDPYIAHIEIAFDVKPKPGQLHHQMFRRAVMMSRQHLLPRVEWNNPMARPRICSPRKKTQLVDAHCLDVGLGISDVLDGTLYIGERSQNGVFYKCYRKTKDEVVGGEEARFKVLPIEEQVVRTEVTFTGTSVADFLGGNKLSDLNPDSLGKVRLYLQFGVPVIREGGAERSPLLRSLIRKSADITLLRLERAGVMCIAQHQVTMDGRRRTKRGPVAIHQKLSVITRNAQRRLTHQFFKT